MFTVRFTADVATEESAENGSYAVSGWIDPEFSRTTVYELASDVRSFQFETLAEAEAFIESTIGTADSYDGRSWYAADTHDDYVSGENYSYAAHIESDGE